MKATFEVGQWVRHPKFGVGLVVEVAQHATLEFAGERKVLAHVQAVSLFAAAPSDVRPWIFEIVVAKVSESMIKGLGLRSPL